MHAAGCHPPVKPAEHARIQQHPDGITAIDAEYVHPGHAAVHLIVDSGHAAFVDPGTNDSVPHLLRALEQLGIAPESVDYVFLTHVHLDHAGGAGLLMRCLPKATCVVHPRGAPHLIDPTKLVAGSIAVYGQANFDRLYGTIRPIAPERIVRTAEGARFALGGRELEVLHTPGHALHHCAYLDRRHASIFTGDSFGISYRAFDTERGPFITPTTTPSQFDLAQSLDSIERMLACAPRALYLMHYSRVTDVPRLGASLKEQLRAIAELAQRHAGAADRAGLIRSGMRAMWLRLLREHGCALPEARIDQLLAADLELNTQGVIAWVDRMQR